MRWKICTARNVFPLVHDRCQILNLLPKKPNTVTSKRHTQRNVLPFSNTYAFSNLDHFRHEVNRIARLVAVIACPANTTRVVKRAPEFHAVRDVVDVFHYFGTEDAGFDYQGFYARREPGKFFGKAFDGA